MAALIITYPVVTPTITLTLRPSFVRLVNPQATMMQVTHIAQGGEAYVFSPGASPVVNRVLPVEIISLHEANESGYTGWEAVRAFIMDTLQGAKNPCTLTDPDSVSYVVRYQRGLDTITEGQQGRFFGVLLFRQEAP